MFQNADSACDDDRDPKAISDKGPAASKAVDLGQRNLFAEFDAEDRAKHKKENAALWYFFVHINGDDVRAELSFPKHIEDGQFKGFNERLGRTVQDATLFCTTFPCHICAKHIAGAGIEIVYFLEP